MPKSPFNPKDVPDFSLPRNSFDLSNNELFTTQFGRIMPVSVTEVIPGDTFRMNSCSVGVRGMPTAFPIQTPIKGRLSWFYVRNRTLWKDWEDFIFKTKDGLTAPYLRYTRDKSNLMSTGSLADALGLPTTKGVVGTSFSTLFTNSYLNSEMSSGNGVFFTNGDSSTIITAENLNTLLNGNPQEIPSMSALRTSYFSHSSTIPSDRFIAWFSSYTHIVPSLFQVHSTLNGTFNNCFVGIFEKPTYLGGSSDDLIKVPYLGNSLIAPLSGFSSTAVDGGFILNFPIPSSLIAFASTLENDFSIGFFYRSVTSSGILSPSVNSVADWRSVTLKGSSAEINDVPADQNPFLCNSSSLPQEPIIRVNALPFRAYEMICRYFFRNDLNNPNIFDGQVEYNQFIPTDEGGADENEYTYHYHNLELDMFTSAVQSPQFGAAPLVGMEYRVGAYFDTAKFKFTSEDSQEYEVTGAVDPATGRLVNILSFPDNIPSGNLRQLTNLVDAGFSINTLRNVNSFQRFLENTIRRGMRYRNQLMSHFGVDVDYPDIDVPQYLGGVSAYINAGQINNQSQTGSVGLGDYIGTLEGRVTMERNFSHYCPEHGFIIGVFSISPTPIYPQSTVPYLLKSNPFDYYQSEFGKTGYVPIPYSILSPLEGSQIQPDSQSSVFGYQRAFYDYMAKTDNIHGDFRNTLLDFTLARQFMGRPLLGRQFTQVHPEDYDHVFLNRNIATEYNSNSKFLLSVSTSIDMLRPIPRHGVPSLE